MRLLRLFGLGEAFLERKSYEDGVRNESSICSSDVVIGWASSFRGLRANKGYRMCYELLRVENTGK